MAKTQDVPIYGFGKCTKNIENSFKLLDAYYDLGGNFIDTGNNYQDGSSEEFIGEWAESRGIRDQLFIATKYSSNCKVRDASVKQKVLYSGNSNKSLHLAIESSLKNLRTSCIDLLYLHWWDFTTSIEEVMRSLHTLIQHRKFYTPAWVVSRANQYARDHGLTPFVIYQGAWNILDRSFEREIISMARAEGMALAPWNVLVGGKILTDAEEERRRNSGERGRTLFNPAWECSEQEKLVCKALETVAEEVGAKSISAVAIAYVIWVATPQQYFCMGSLLSSEIGMDLTIWAKEVIRASKVSIGVDFRTVVGYYSKVGEMVYRITDDTLTILVVTVYRMLSYDSAGESTMASIPTDIIPQIVSYLPNSCLHKFTLIPPFLVPAQRQLFKEIELSSFIHCSSLASLLRDTESPHLASYVRRMHIIIPAEDATSKVKEGNIWINNAQEVLVELLAKFILLEELDVNFRTTGSYRFLEWGSQLSHNLREALIRTLSLPSLHTFRIHRASFTHSSTIDTLFSNRSDKNMKTITLEAVEIRSSEPSVTAALYPFSHTLQPGIAVEHHLNFDIVNSQLLLWLLQPQSPIILSTVRRLGLMKFMGHKDRVTELFAKTTSLHVLELFLYREHFTNTLPSLISPPSLHTVIFHFSNQVDTIYDIIKRLESSIPTLNSANNIEKVTITYIVTSNSSPTDMIGSKDLWRRLCCYITRHDRRPRLKKFHFILFWVDVAKLGNEVKDLESQTHSELAEQYASTLAGAMKEGIEERGDGTPAVNVQISYDIPEVWARVHDYPRK